MKRTCGAWPILLPAAGFIAWASIFILLYGVQAIGCRLAWDNVDIIGALSVQRLVQIAIYLTALAGTIGIWLWVRSLSSRKDGTSTHTFLTKVSNHGALAAVGAVAFCFAGVAWLTAC